MSHHLVSNGTIEFYSSVKYTLKRIIENAYDDTSDRLVAQETIARLSASAVDLLLSGDPLIEHFATLVQRIAHMERRDACGSDDERDTDVGDAASASAEDDGDGDGDAEDDGDGDADAQEDHINHHATLHHDQVEQAPDDPASMPSVAPQGQPLTSTELLQIFSFLDPTRSSMGPHGRHSF